MAGNLTVGGLQVGDSITAAENFTIKTPASPDGTLVISRGNLGAETQTVLTVDVDGQVKLGVGMPNTQAGLMTYLLPSQSDKWRGIYRAGFDHAFRNQQWGGPFGGEMLDVATGTLYRTEFATGYIDQSQMTVAFGYDASNQYAAQGFKVAETQTVAAVWVRLQKTGNPTSNVQLAIYSDSAGAPNAAITNGSATAISMKLIGSDATGAFYRFSFPTPPSLTGGTQYHIVVSSSGANSSSNYCQWGHKASKAYPYGSFNVGSSAPAWTPTTTQAQIFLVELSATAQISQSSGIFDGKLAFGDSGASGTLSMSRGLCSSVPLYELIDLNEFTLRITGTAFTKDATILDIGYGQDHDRIVLRSNVTTGFAQVDVYDSGGTKRTVTGTAIDISSGNHDIMIHVRAKNDGVDKVEMYVDGVSQGTPVSTVSILFDDNFRNLGTMWLGGGFGLAPTWSTNSIGTNGFSALPSSLGWTFTSPSGGTEGNMYSVSGGKLYQNANGDTGSQDGYYALTIAAVNATGSFSSFTVRVIKNTNTKGAYGCYSDHLDGSRRVIAAHQEYYLGDDAGTNSFFPQFDAKSVTNIIERYIKGTEAHVYRNHRFIIDDTGNVSASGTNGLRFGDNSTAAGERADAVWSAAKYYIGGGNSPQFTSGSISEFAVWSGDKTSLAATLYNLGTPVSVKQFCGLTQNYLDKSQKLSTVEQMGVSSSPSTTATLTAPTTSPEMEYFIVADQTVISHKNNIFNSGSGNDNLVSISIDGVNSLDPSYTTGTSNYHQPAAIRINFKGNLGLHKIEGKSGTGAGTLSMYGIRRNLVMEPKV